MSHEILGLSLVHMCACPLVVSCETGKWNERNVCAVWLRLGISIGYYRIIHFFNFSNVVHSTFLHLAECEQAVLYCMLQISSCCFCHLSLCHLSLINASDSELLEAIHAWITLPTQFYFGLWAIYDVSILFFFPSHWHRLTYPSAVQTMLFRSWSGFSGDFFPFLSPLCSLWWTLLILSWLNPHDPKIIQLYGQWTRFFIFLCCWKYKFICPLLTFPLSLWCFVLICKLRIGRFFCMESTFELMLWVYSRCLKIQILHLEYLITVHKTASEWMIQLGLASWKKTKLNLKHKATYRV